MPLTREQTKYTASNDTVFLPSVAVDSTLGVRGNSVFTGTATFNNSVVFNVAPSFSTLNTTTLVATNALANGTWTIKTVTPGLTSGERSSLSMYGTFFNYPSDVGPRRIADIIAGYSTGTWGTEYLAFAVGTGAANDSQLVTTERMRIDGSGRITGSNSAVFDIAYQTNAQTGLTYTVVAADSGKIIEMNNASANTLTVNNLSTLATGCQITIIQTGAGQTTVAAGTNVTINATPGLKLRTQWSTATLIKRSTGATDVWILTGDLTA